MVIDNKPPIASVPRAPLSTLKFTASNMLGRITIQDATFDSMIMMYFTVEHDALAKKWAERWQQLRSSSVDSVDSVQTTLRRIKYVARAITKDWRQHHEQQLKGVDESFDLSWDDVEVYWAESAEVAWAKHSMDGACGSECQAAKSNVRGLAVPNRHKLLMATDQEQWAVSGAVKAASADDGDVTGTADRQGVIQFHVRELRQVPLSELMLNFPASTIHMKPFDVAKLASYGLAGLSVVQIVWTSSLSLYGTVIALGTLSVFALRVFWRYQIARVYAEHRAIQRATEQAYSRGKASLSSLVHEATLVETREAQLVLTALCSMHACEGGGDATDGVSVDSLQAQCDAILQWMGKTNKCESVTVVVRAL